MVEIKMKVLIFGGTGFIGRNLIKELLLNNYQVFVVTRNSKKKSSTLGEKVQWIEWNNSLPLAVNPDLGDFDGVINLAGESIGDRRWTPEVKEEILASRVRTTRAIVEAINNGSLRCKLLINGSAVGYYGPRLDDEVAENEKPGEDFLAEVCKAWEDEAYKVKGDSTRVVTIRTGVVLGKEGALTKMVMPFRYYIGGPMGSGKQWFSWIHIDDWVGLVRYIMEKGNIRGPVNATAPNPIKMKDFAKALGRALNRPAWFPVPEFMLRLALGQMAEMLLHGQRAIPKKMLEAGYQYKFPEAEVALGDILIDKKENKAG